MIGLSTQAGMFGRKPAGGGPTSVLLAEYDMASDTPVFLEAGITGGVITPSNLNIASFNNNFAYATNPVASFASPNGTTDASLAVANARYYEITLTGATTITRITLDAARGGSATPRGFAITSSADAHAVAIATEEIPTVRSTFTSYDFTGLTCGNVIRFYTFSPTQGSTQDHDNLKIYGY